jgi:chromosome segregation ATPase
MEPSEIEKEYRSLELEVNLINSRLEENKKKLVDLESKCKAIGVDPQNIDKELEKLKATIKETKDKLETKINELKGNIAEFNKLTN